MEGGREEKREGGKVGRSMDGKQGVRKGRREGS